MSQLPSLPQITVPVMDGSQFTLPWRRFFQTAAQLLSTYYTGQGSPEGVIIALPGSMYLNSLGGAGATLWVKETGSGNTGWVAK